MVPVHGDRMVSESCWRPQKNNCYEPNISSKVDEYWPNTPTPLSHWRKIFNNSSAVHFFSSGTTKLFSYFFSSAHTSFFNCLPSGSAKLKVPREPQYCAYALLGPHYCPLSYFGSPDFWSSLKSSGTPLPITDQALSILLAKAQLVVKYSFRHSYIRSCGKMLF